MKFTFIISFILTTVLYIIVPMVIDRHENPGIERLMRLTRTSHLTCCLNSFSIAVINIRPKTT